MKLSKITKNKYVLNEKIANPPEILEYIKEKYENGATSMSSDQIIECCERMYRRDERIKLIRYYENLKLRPVVKSIHRFLLHLAVNIGPQAKTNEDIEDHLKEEPSEGGLDELKNTLANTVVSENVPMD